MSTLSSVREIAHAQTPSPSPPQSPAPAPESKPVEIKSPTDAHHFWDKENDWLFAGVGASRTLDYFSTLNFRRRGRQEVPAGHRILQHSLTLLVEHEKTSL